MRLDADRHHAGSTRLVLALALGLVTVLGCSKTWVLGVGPDAGGQGGGAASAPAGGAGDGGGSGGPRGTGGFPGFGGHPDQGGGGGGHGGGSCNRTGTLSSISPATEVVFIVGRNNSMGSSFGDTTRMAAVQTAMLNVVKANEGDVNFGYQGFPSFNGCSNGSCGVCADDRVPTTSLASKAIDAELRHSCDQSTTGMACVASSEYRPIAAALDAALEVFSTTFDSARDRYVVLVTDGAASCSVQDPMKACTDAQMKMAMLAGWGLKLSIVAVGDGVQNDGCLKSLSMQGAMLYGATDSMSLATSFDAIASAAAARPCTFELTQAVPDPTLVRFVVQDKGEIHFDPSGSNGWSYGFSGMGAPTRIELHGRACNLLQAIHSPVISIETGCSPCMVPSSPNNCL